MTRLETRSYAGAVLPFLPTPFSELSMATTASLIHVPVPHEKLHVLPSFRAEENTSNTAPELQSAPLLHTDAGPVATKQRLTEVAPVAAPHGGAPRDVIFELRHLTGLTWDNLAELLSVTRRSLHLWANGGSMNTPNERRVRDLLSAMRAIDRGTARENRSLLLTRHPDGRSLQDLLRESHFDQAIKLVGRGNGRAAPAKSLVGNARSKVTGPSLADMLGTSAEKAHADSEVALQPRRGQRRV